MVYCDVSPAAANAVFDVFKLRTRLRVVAVFPDGSQPLADRLRAERREARPTADVWWSEDPTTTLLLADEGAFAPYHSESADRHAGDAGWPAEMRDKPPEGAETPTARWYAFARQLRVVAYNPARVKPDEIPASLTDLLRPRWRGRTGIADPRFGPAAAQLTALYDLDSGQTLRHWLTAFGTEGLRVFPNDEAVATAVASGEVDIGLCSSGSAHIAAAAGALRVRVLHGASILSEPGAFVPRSTFRVEAGQFQVPLVAAIVESSLNRENAERLVDYLLCNEAAQALARPPIWAAGLHEQTLNEHARLWDGAGDKPRPVRLDLRIDGLNLPRLAAARQKALELWRELRPPAADR